MRYLLKTLPVIFFGGLFIFVILQVPYPDSLVQANLVQISLFFIPFFLALISILNIFLRKLILSIFISFGLILLLTLKALESLNIITGLLVIIAIGLLISYFKKVNKRNPSASSGSRDLTKLPKMPKLTKL